MPRRPEAPGAPSSLHVRCFRVFIYGAGKVGTGLTRALRATGARVTLRPARRGPPKTLDPALDVLVLAVRDRDLPAAASAFAPLVPRRAVAVHVAGALDTTPLEALRGRCAGVAQMHPMISFATPRFTPSLAGGSVHVQGDPAAVKRARALARRLGMVPRTVPGLDTVAYHAAAGLVANGAAALASAGAELLGRAGVPAPDASRMLGALLGSVAQNIAALGFPVALTGPVRRGDAPGLTRHLETLERLLPTAVPLYVAASEAQLPLARALGDAPAASLDAVERVLADARARGRR